MSLSAKPIDGASAVAYCRHSENEKNVEVVHFSVSPETHEHVRKLLLFLKDHPEKEQEVLKELTRLVQPNQSKMSRASFCQSLRSHCPSLSTTLKVGGAALLVLGGCAAVSYYRTGEVLGWETVSGAASQMREKTGSLLFGARATESEVAADKSITLYKMAHALGESATNKWSYFKEAIWGSAKVPPAVDAADPVKSAIGCMRGTIKGKMASLVNRIWG